MRHDDGAAGSPPESYPAACKWIHWITALCVLAVIPMGILMLRLPQGALQNRMFDLHRSTGILILGLAILRVLARWIFGIPAPDQGLTRLERVASMAAQHSLLVLIFAMPLIGWASTSAYRAEVSVYGLFTLPPILPRDPALYQALSWVHTVLGFLMAFLVAAHIGGALRHGFLKRDRVLHRMLPGFAGDWLDQRTGRARKST
jgi:cytochrome b561